MVTIREATLADVAAYAAVQEEEWDESMAAGDLKIESRIDLFPQGTLVAEQDGVVVGCASFIRLPAYSIEQRVTWEDLTDNGWCSTHCDDGTVLFGVDLSISRRAPRSAAPLIFMAAMELAMRLGVDRIVWGGRMPRYYKYADEMSAHEYAATKTKRGRYLDPEIELYSKIPGVQILGVVPEYFKDWESLNNGVMLSWTNPIVRFPILKIARGRVLDLLYRSSHRAKPVQS
jgi:hypothetical protein